MGLTFLLLLLLLLLQILTQKLLKSSSKALQMTYKSLPKLQEADGKKGGMAGGVKTYSNDGCHLVVLDPL